MDENRAGSVKQKLKNVHRRPLVLLLLLVFIDTRTLIYFYKTRTNKAQLK